MNPFRETIAGALETVRQVAGADILYRRENTVLKLRATVGQTSIKVTSASEGVEVRQKWRDFLIDVELLLIDGERSLPKRGDEITDGADVFLAANIPGGNLYEVEAQGLQFRIHAKRKGAT